MKLLLGRKEVNLNSGANYGGTPLCEAAERGYEGIVKLLLGRKEVNPNSGANYGGTPLCKAAERGYEGIVKLLLDRKEVDPDSRDNDRRTPLWGAAEGRHEEIVRLLQRRIDAESGTGANDTLMPPSYLLQNSYEGLLVSQLSPQPPRDSPGMLPQDVHPALSSAISPPDTPDVSSETSSQAPPLDSPPLALSNLLPLTTIAAARMAAIAALLAIIIRLWL